MITNNSETSTLNHEVVTYPCHALGIFNSFHTKLL